MFKDVELPKSMEKAPAYVRDFLKEAPSVWDDTKFLDGYPGKYVVLARRSRGHWYIAGITDGDGGNLSFRRETLRLNVKRGWKLTLPPRGGFVAVVK